MLRSTCIFLAGVLVGAVVGIPVLGTSSPSVQPAANTNVAQLRLYTIDKGRLDDFAKAWLTGVYPLRTQQGYRIPFAGTIAPTNQFVWLLTYDGPEAWEAKEAAYYKSAARAAVAPDPAQWIARPEQWFVTPVIPPAKQ